MTIFVDLDGTFLDTLNSNFHAYSNELIKLGINLDLEYFSKRCFGNSAKDFLRDLCLKKEDVEKIIQNKHRNYSKYFQLILLNESLLVGLTNLKSTHEIMLFTNASRVGTLDLLKYFNLADFFDGILTIEDFEYPKPNPKSFQFALAHNKINTIPYLIDDSYDNLTISNEMGFRSISVSNFYLEFFQSS
jgi:FMN phosphatase YigB (HAD superfamily)